MFLVSLLVPKHVSYVWLKQAQWLWVLLFSVFCMQCFVCYGGLWGQEFGTLPNVSPSLLLRWDLPGHGHPGCRIYMNAEWIFLCNLVRIIL